jgi:hypothetical protein
MDQLRALAKRLGNPGQEKLYLAARKRGIAVTRNQIKQFLAEKPERQIFGPLPQSKGQTGAEEEGLRMQLDLIQFSTAPSKVGRETFRYIAVLVDVFSRMAYTAPCKTKEPAEVAPVLRRMLDALPKKPAVISTDKGNEWVGPVDALLDAKGIARRTKDPRDTNALGVVDRLIMNLKTRLAESLSAEPGEWASRIKEVTAAYNETGHATVHGEPVDAKNPIQNFLITQDNAGKLKGNQTLLESRKKELADKGGFRRPLRAAGGAFRRGFKATYGEVEKVQDVRGSLITPEGGGEKIDVKRVKPVGRDTGDVQPWLGGMSALDSRKKDKLIPMMVALIDHLKDGERSVASAALYLKGEMGSMYEDTLREVGYGKHLAMAIRLFEPPFELVKGGYYVKMA